MVRAIFGINHPRDFWKIWNLKNLKLTMKPIFSILRKINLGCTVNRFSGSPSVLKNVLVKKRKTKHEQSKWKTSMIILHFDVDKTYHLVLRDSTLVLPEIAPSVHLSVHFFTVYFFVCCFLTMPLNRTKLKYGIWS